MPGGLQQGVAAAGGVQGAIIELAREAGVPVFVDPAAIKDYSKYAGATAITPNATETALATGMKVHERGGVSGGGGAVAEEAGAGGGAADAGQAGELSWRRGRGSGVG